MRILGIETSCDDTGVCLIEATGTFGPSFSYRVLGNGLSSQTAVHAKYGGVFPNLAKQEHAKNIVPMLTVALAEAGMLKDGATEVPTAMRELLEREPVLYTLLEAFLQTHEKPDIDALAVTAGPGLPPALWVGVNFARVLARAWHLPLVAVNHMEGHVVMSMMQEGGLAPFEFPLLSLLVSGGHTELVVSKGFGSYEKVGKTRDDAAGEAFDKVARMLGLPYPGGPHISRLAAEARSKNVASDVKLPRPMMHEDNLDFSFSGLKTAVLRIVEAGAVSDDMKLNIAREFEEAVAEVLVVKTLRAIGRYAINAVVMGGGVSANTYIRERLSSALADEGGIAKLLVCPPEFSTDNGLMIALPGYFHALQKHFSDPTTLRADPNLALGAA